MCAIDLETPNSTFCQEGDTRPLWKDALCEFTGTFAFVYISLAGVNQSILLGQDQLTIAICFAVGLTTGISISDASGAHLNPAVSVLTFLVDDGFDAIRMLTYMAAQLLAGLLAGLLVLAVYASWITDYKNKETFAGAFGTLRARDNSLFSSILDQFIGSAILMMVIATVPQTKFKPAIVGIALGALGLFQGTNGFAFNMARDLGPRIASAIVLGDTPFTAAGHWFWVPIVVPFFGVPFGWVLAFMIRRIQI